MRKHIRPFHVFVWVVDKPQKVDVILKSKFGSLLCQGFPFGSATKQNEPSAYATLYPIERL
jgi:hypothetical protein